jgi:anti-sigma B factor antagonist
MGVLEGKFLVGGLLMAADPASPVPELSLETEKTPAETVIRCSGRITSNTSELLKAATRSAMAESKTVVLDLTHVSYLDSSGLGAIVGLYVSAKREGGKLKLINLSPRVKELFSLTRLAPLFEGHEDMLGMTPD